MSYRYTPKPGDIVTTSGTGVVSGVINLASFGIPGRHASHIGIITDVGGRRLVLESTSVLPESDLCEILKRPVKGVQGHGLASVAKRPGRAWVHPLVRPLYSHEAQRLSIFLQSHIGTPYDLRGALRSGGFLFAAAQSVLRDEDLSTLFCSELVMAALSYIGIFDTANASRWSPNKAVRRLEWAGLLRPRIELSASNLIATRNSPAKGSRRG